MLRHSFRMKKDKNKTLSGWYHDQDEGLSFTELQQQAVLDGVMTENDVDDQNKRVEEIDRLVEKGQEAAHVSFLDVALSLDRVKLIQVLEKKFSGKWIHASDNERRIYALEWAEADAFRERTIGLTPHEREELEIKEGRRSREEVERHRQIIHQVDAEIDFKEGKMKPTGEA